MGIGMAIFWLSLSVVITVISALQDECLLKPCIQICNEIKLNGPRIIKNSKNSNELIDLASYNLPHRPCKEEIQVEIQDWTILEVNPHELHILLCSKLWFALNYSLR
jgi:hypothetical protein